LAANATLPGVMKVWKHIGAAALGALVLLVASPATAGTKRPRPSDVPGAQTAVAPNDFQVFNDYASPERTYASRFAVVHYVVLGIDAPPLNDDDLDAVPDYVERVGDAADLALAYYQHRGFHAVLRDTAGPDARPDIYVSRFAPGTLGVAFPASRAEGGAFAVIANNLDPSAGRSFASIYTTVAHELFHLVQFSYFEPNADPQIPTWILEGTAAALESRVNPELDDLVESIQLRSWFSAADRSLTAQSYGSQLFWRYFDRKAPAFVPAFLARLAAQPVDGEGERAVASTYRKVAGKPFAQAFHGFALSVAAEHGNALETTGVVTRGRAYHRSAAPLSIHYLRLALLRAKNHSLTVTFPHGHAGAAATIAYQLANDIPGQPAHTGKLAPRGTDGGHRLTFAVPRTLLANPRLSSVLLVISNGGLLAVAYAVSAR
jgi:hypothetical protein